MMEDIQALMLEARAATAHDPTTDALVSRLTDALALVGQERDAAHRDYVSLGRQMADERELHQMTQAENTRLRGALANVREATKSHVDGRDLLDELHPRHTLDIKRRVDGRETWHEGDWLSNLRQAMKMIDAALTEDQR